MRQESMSSRGSAERTVRDIRRKTRKQYSAEEKIRIVLSGLRGEDSVDELCRREGIAESLYYSWSKEFLEAGKKRLSGDTRCDTPLRTANLSSFPSLHPAHVDRLSMQGACRRSRVLSVSP